mmetsp:Transcript_46020/g.75079  ORF Transcript_46020/g.75079 Transcript_46020/m.75079 type:complete len:210 (+) Transcript_46020:181-810(+)
MARFQSYLVFSALVLLWAKSAIAFDSKYFEKPVPHPLVLRSLSSTDEEYISSSPAEGDVPLSETVEPIGLEEAELVDRDEDFDAPRPAGDLAPDMPEVASEPEDPQPQPEPASHDADGVNVVAGGEAPQPPMPEPVEDLTSPNGFSEPDSPSLPEPQPEPLPEPVPGSVPGPAPEPAEAADIDPDAIDVPEDVPLSDPIPVPIPALRFI